MKPIFLLLLVAFVAGAMFLYLFQHRKQILKWLASLKKPVKPHVPQVMKPRSEEDCPICRTAREAGLRPSPNCTHMPDPWSEVKDNRGRKKTICTRYQFCSNLDCKYYLIADEKIHALVGSGTHGKYEEVQDLICQACHKKLSIRKHTILFRLKTHSGVVRLALQLMALGVDTSALEEALEIRESTLRMLLVRSGVQARKLHERFFQGLELGHVQLDELWANVKQAQQDLWVWVAVDARTKIIRVRFI